MTILELSITGALLMVVLASILSVFLSVQRASVRERARAESLNQLRITMGRLTRDARQTTRICPASNAGRLDMDTFVQAQPRRMVYWVDGTVLKRTVSNGTMATCAAIGSSGYTVTILERLLSSELFTYSPGVADPSTVSIRLRIRPERFSTDPLQLELRSEVTLRNA